MGKKLASLLLVLLLAVVAATTASAEEHFVTLEVGKWLKNAEEEAAAAATTSLAFEDAEEDHIGAMDESSFRIPLLHREAPVSPLRTRNATRKELLLQRLKKDQLRSQAIAANIKLASGGFSRSDLKPMSSSSSLQAASSVEEFETPLISGVSGGSGDYFARIGVGTPAKDVYMVADTGSDISWLQCAPCRRCYKQQDPLFNPSFSSSFKQLACGSSICGQLKVKGCNRRKKCLYQVSYGDGSFTVGDFSTETLTFGSHTVREVPMGCGRNNQGLFHGAAGLLGLGRGALSFPSQRGSSYGGAFSYCLPRRDSRRSASLVFGPSSIPAAARFTNLLPNTKLDTYYYVALSQIRVGGSPLRIPPGAFLLGSRGTGGVIVDSGTAVTRLTTPAYNALRDAFKAMVQSSLPSAPGISLFDTCYDLSSMKTAKLPAVALDFDGGASMALPADGIMVAVDDEGTYCLAFAPEDEAFTIIGNVQQQTFRISIDNDKKQMGIVADQCS